MTRLQVGACRADDRAAPGAMSPGAGVRQVQIEAKSSSAKGCQAGILIESGPLSDDTSFRRLSNFTVSNNGTGILFAYAAGTTSYDELAGFHRWILKSNAITDNAVDGIHMSADTFGMARSIDVLIPMNVTTGSIQ